MQELNLPVYEFRVQEIGGKEMIYDSFRQKYVRLTPEEWVRQHFVQYLVQEQGVPKSLVAIEMAFTSQGMRRRADVVVYSREGRPVLMVECKSPEVAIRQEVFDQVARYNKVVKAEYLVATNGLVHYCCRLDPSLTSFHFLNELPAYNDL